MIELYGEELPEPIPKNTSKAIRIARRLHQDDVNRHTRNTKMRRWDKYWIEIYNLVLEQLSNEGKAKR